MHTLVVPRPRKLNLRAAAFDTSALDRHLASMINET
jgi:hypothetical protein